MNQILAVWWAQMRALRNYANRGGVPWMLIISVIWYGGFAFLAGLIAIVLSEPEIANIAGFFPGALLFIFLYWQLVPLLMAASGASLDLRKLKVYPIPDTHLFAIEVLLRTTAGIEMLLILGGAALGIALNPALPGWSALSVLPFILFNLLIALALRDIVTRLLARRRVREILALAFVAVWIVPQFLAMRSGPPTPRPKGGRPPPGWLSDLLQGNLWKGFPWTATANLLQSEAVLLSLGVMTAWCAAAGAFALWQFRRTLAFDPEAAGARGTRTNERSSRLDVFYRLPSLILPDPLSALVEKELRYLARSPRFRMVFLMGCTLGIFVTRALTRGGFGEWGPGYLTAASMYALLLVGEICFWNTFGFDRSAAQVYFLAPLPFTRALAAKNIAATFYFILEILVVMTVYAIMGFPATLYTAAEAFAVTGTVGVFMFAAGNLVSVHNARGVNPRSSMRSGAAGRTQALLLLIYPVAMAPVALAYLAAWALDTHAAFFGVMAVLAAIGGVVYKVTLDTAAERAWARRETMIAALSEGTGPITT